MRKRRRKQKRLVSLALIVIALLLIIGIVVFALIKNNSVTEPKDDAIDVTSNEVVETFDENEPSQSDNKDLYDALISKDGKMSFSYYKEHIYNEENITTVDEFIGHLTAMEYTLPEFVEASNAVFEDEDYYYAGGDIESISYAFIDCGKDGNRELVLNIVCPIVEEQSVLTLVLKDMNDSLQVVYGFCTWSRSATTINEYGYISGGGSGGATLHGFDTGYINADGEYKYGFYEEEQADLNSFADFQEHVPFDSSVVEGNVVVYSLRTTVTTAEDYMPQYYSYKIYDNNYEEMDVPNLYTDSSYKTLMDSFTAIDFISYEDIEKLENDKLAEIGVTEEIKNGKEIEFTKIDM